MRQESKLTMPTSKVLKTSMSAELFCSLAVQRNSNTQKVFSEQLYLNHRFQSLPLLQFWAQSMVFISLEYQALVISPGVLKNSIFEFQWL